jgi:hypothetical protein
MSHWYKYNEDGTIESRYDSDLREARKEKLFISITTVEKEVRRNWSIEDYIQKQTIKACQEYPKFYNEDEADYVKRIKMHSLKHSNRAADIGNEIHKVCEDYPQMPLNQDYYPYYDMFARWHDRNITRTDHREIMLADPKIGVAGRIDFIGEHKEHGPVILDWKTQDIKKKASFYSSWPRQLAAGRHFYWLKTGIMLNCASVVIDSKEPSEPVIKVWSEEEINLAYKEFLCHAWLYFTEKDYWPGINGRWDLDFRIEQ